MTGPRPARAGAGPWVVAACVAVVLTALSAVAGLQVSASQEDAREQRALAAAQAAAGDVARRMDAYQEVLHGLAAWVGAQGWPSRADWHAYVAGDAALARYPGIQVVGAAPHVPAGAARAHAAAVRADVAASALAYPRFPTPPTGREAAPIAYLEPQAGNARAFGFDLLADPVRRAAVLAARDSGAPRATAPVRLVQEVGTQRGVLVVVPVYAPGAARATPAQRRAAFRGVVYAAFRAGDLVDAALGGRAPGTALLDLGPLGRPAPAPGAAAPLVGEVPADGARRVDVGVAGRRWGLLVADAQPLSAAERWTPLLLVLGGSLIGLLAGALVVASASGRVRAERGAAARARQLETVVAASLDAVVTVDQDDRVVSWNPAAVVLFGRAEEEVLGRSCTEVLPGGLRGAVGAAGAGGAAGAPGPGAAGARALELEAVGADGSALVVEATVAPWRGESGSFVTAVVRDVTERRAGERAVRRAHRLLSAVLDAATGTAIVAVRPDGVVSVFNEGAERLLGRRAGEVLGQVRLSAFHDPEELARRADELGVASGLDALVAAAREGAAETREWTWVRADGDRRQVSVTVTAMQDPDGAVGFVAVADDLTEARRLERERLHLADRLETLLASTEEGICTVDVQGRVTSANRAFAELVGHGVEELLGVDAHALLHGRRADGSAYPPEECPVRQTAVRGGTRRVDSEVLWRADGSAVPVEYLAAPLRGGGSTEGAVVTVRDISERKRTERALLDAVAREREVALRLRELDAVRADFVATMSHELRTPLTNICGYLEMLHDGDVGALPPEQARMVGVAQRNAQRLLALVEDLLVLSRVETGGFRVRQDQVVLGELVAAVAGDVALPARERGLVLRVVDEGAGPVLGDHAQLERVLAALLGNAVKFTPPGGRVTVTVGTSGGRARVDVADTGVGMSAEEQGRLFDRFYRAPGAHEQAVQGAGVGLSVAKTIVDQHGGEIEVASSPGAGTTMSLLLPLLVPAAV